MTELFDKCVLLKEIMLKGVLNEQGVLLFEVSGDSMLPTIRSGMTVAIENCTFADLKLNDIVLYSKKGYLILHRVICLKGEKLYLKGDSEDYIEKVDKQRILGRISNAKKIIPFNKVIKQKIDKYYLEIAVQQSKVVDIKLLGE